MHRSHTDHQWGDAWSQIGKWWQDSPWARSMRPAEPADSTETAAPGSPAAEGSTGDAATAGTGSAATPDTATSDTATSDTAATDIAATDTAATDTAATSTASGPEESGTASPGASTPEADGTAGASATDGGADPAATGTTDSASAGTDGTGAPADAGPATDAAHTGGDGPLTGVFVGSHPDDLARYENWLGKPAEAVLAYTGEGSWADMNPGYVMSQFPGHTLLFSIPLFPATSSLAEVADGVGDAHFREYARTIMEKADEVAAPDGNIYVRTAWEMGGEWNRWGQQGNDNPELFIQAFQRFADAFHEVSDRLKVVWDVTPDRGDTSKFYPGDEHVDVISQDFYWHPQWWGNDAADAWARFRDAPYGPRWLEEFADQHGKPTAYSEWGVPADHDATAWIEGVRDWFNDPSHDVLWQTYWDSNSAYPGLMSDGSDPASGAAYRDAFG